MITIIWRSSVLNGLLTVPPKILPGQVSEVALEGGVLTGAVVESDWPGRRISEWSLFSREPVANINHNPVPKTRSRAG